MNFDSFVLTAATATLTDEPQARAHADALEFRMDLADEPLSALEAYDGELPILATNRAAWEGGEAEEDEKERLEALVSATAIDAVEAIDIELASIRDGSASSVLEAASERSVSVVASAHNFEETPARERMVEILTEGSEHATVGKLAVKGNTLEDTLELLSVTRELTQAGKTVATMAMGEVGSHTRAVAPVYGSKIGYAPVDPAEATAPGQYDLQTLSRLVSALS